MLETIILMCCSIPTLGNILPGYSIDGIFVSAYIVVKALSFYLENKRILDDKLFFYISRKSS